MTTKKIVILLVSLFIFSCSKKNEEIVPQESPELIEMRKQKAIWEARKISSYTIDHIKLCYCPGTGRYKFVVKDQVLQSAFNIDTNQFVETTSLKDFKTVDQIYAFMETTLKAKPFFAYITYDKEGVPTRVSFDINELIQDEEIEYFYGGLVGTK